MFKCDCTFVYALVSTHMQTYQHEHAPVGGTPAHTHITKCTKVNIHQHAHPVPRARHHTQAKGIPAYVRPHYGFTCSTHSRGIHCYPRQVSVPLDLVETWTRGCTVCDKAYMLLRVYYIAHTHTHTHSSVTVYQLGSKYVFNK